MIPISHDLCRSMAGLAIAGLVLQGCVTTSGYTISADDSCAAERQQLKSVEDYFVQSAIQGAVGGALFGALAGGLIGGDGASALIGAAGGAVVGGLGGYFLAKQQASSDRTQLVRSIHDDVVTENRQIDRTSAAFAAVTQCRVAAAKAIKADIAAGRIDRAAAEARLSRQRALYDEDITVARNLGAKMTERANEYQFASNALLKDGGQDEVARSRAASVEGSASAESAPTPSTNDVVRLTETNQLKRKTLDAQLNDSKTVANAAFELDGKISHRVRVRPIG